MSKGILNKSVNKKIPILIDGCNGSATLIHDIPTGCYALTQIEWNDPKCCTEKLIIISEQMIEGFAEVNGIYLFTSKDN